RTRGDQGHLPVAEEPAEADADEHRGGSQAPRASREPRAGALERALQVLPGHCGGFCDSMGIFGLIGKKFHRLTVLRFSHYDRAHRKHYLCQCECGKRKAVQMSLLKNGNTKSCGCLADEVRRVARRLPNNGGVINHLILQYKRHARNRGIPYRLSRDEFDALVRMPCHYCGVVGGNLKKTKNCREGF